MMLENQKNTSSIIPLEHRCSCGKLLFKGLISSSEFEIKCRNCHAINFIGGNYGNPSDNFRYSILFSLDGNIVDASDSAVKIIGYGKEELMSRKIQEIFPLLKISTYAHLSKISQFLEIEPFAWDTLCQNKNGGFALVTTNLTYIKNRMGNTLAMFECVQKPKKYQDGSSVKNIPNNCKFMARINTEGVYTYVSVKLATLLGYPSIEMLGKPIFDFYPNEDKEKIKEIFSQNIVLKESFKLSPHNVFCSNKDIINFESYFASNYNDRGQLRGFQIMSWLIP